jgi:hypothetical protein
MLNKRRFIMQDNHQINQQVNLQPSGPRTLTMEEVQAVSGGSPWSLLAKVITTIILALVPSGSGNDSKNPHGHG